MLILVTGSPSSGKSLIAETIVMNIPSEKRFYIATMKNQDSESNAKVEKHRAMRKDKNFITIEKSTNLGDITAEKNCVYLLECITNLAANEMFEKDGAGYDCADKVSEDIMRLADSGATVVAVTNEVSQDGFVYDDFTNKYIENITKINAKTAMAADVVIESVAGIPVYLKGERYEFI